MGQLTDNMPGSIEGAQAAMEMIIHGELAAACLALLAFTCHARRLKLRSAGQRYGMIVPP